MLQSCSTVPVTGRKQLSLIPSSQMMSMSFQQYDEFLKSNKLSTDAAKTTPQWKEAYQFALDNDFRFLSYGDSCLFLP